MPVPLTLLLALPLLRAELLPTFFIPPPPADADADADDDADDDADADADDDEEVGERSGRRFADSDDTLAIDC